MNGRWSKRVDIENEEQAITDIENGEKVRFSGDKDTIDMSRLMGDDWDTPYWIEKVYWKGRKQPVWFFSTLEEMLEEAKNIATYENGEWFQKGNDEND
jgi:hypothetical protein